MFMKPVMLKSYTTIIKAIIFFLVQLNSVQGQDIVLKFDKGMPAYIVASPHTDLEKRITDRLGTYLEKVLGVSPKIVPALSLVPAKRPAIILSSKPPSRIKNAKEETSPEAYTLSSKVLGEHNVLVASGNTTLGLKRAVQKLILKSEQGDALIIPDLQLSESPWILKREWTFPNWTPQFARGVFHNPHADLRPNIWLYGDKQLADYIEMLDWFGYSGGQFGGSTYGYAVNGSREAYRDRILKIAKALRSNGQNVTYRIWGAQFNAFGWVNPEVTYTPAPGNTAFNDPKVRATFEKEYNNFAEMAPYVDMVIGQFFDPGQLKSREDVFSYMHLLIDKFRIKKPGIQLGIMFWAADAFKEGSETSFMKELIKNNFSDALLLENTMPHTYKPGARESLHRDAKLNKLKLGIWGWHTQERETDQAPNMYVNTHVLSSVYRQIRDTAYKIYPLSYWSEMESYHLNNIFTTYSASQLLWNPDRDPDEIQWEITDGIWGPVNGVKVLRAIRLIEDTRSGYTWDTYWKGRPGHVVGTEDAQNDMERAQNIINELANMKTDERYVPKFPLPFPPATFIELMIPHIRQIKAFAEFRIAEKKVRDAAVNGSSKEELTNLANEAWKPVPEYNTWVGVFGQNEFRTQQIMMDQLAKDLDIKITQPTWTLYRDADRYLEKMQNLQKRSAAVIRFHPGDAVGRSEFYWPEEKVRKCVELLVETGRIKKVGEDTYQLAYWENYKMQ
jgi:hypothetical protein